MKCKSFKERKIYTFLTLVLLQRRIVFFFFLHDNDDYKNISTSIERSNSYGRINVQTEIYDVIL